MSGSKEKPVEQKPELTFEQTLAILAQVPKAEVDEMEANRPKRTRSKRKRPKK